MYRDWIHFIGSKYYSINSFVKEAKEYSINRRISLNNLKRLDFGDRIFLAQGGSKSSIIFGYFVLTTVSGLPRDVVKELEESKCIEFKDSDRKRILRGCGSYEVRGSYKIIDSEGFLEVVCNSGIKSKLGIGGEYKPIPLDVNRVKTRIPFMQGYRDFNFEKLKEDYNRLKLSGSRIILKDYYYREDIAKTGMPVKGKTLIDIEDYSLKE